MTATTAGEAAADSGLVAPRPLTRADASHLRTVFELQLRIACEEDREDAADLIGYALDMVGRGKNVGSVVTELEFMEYEVCDRACAARIGRCLSSFFREVAREMSGATVGIDLSNKAASLRSKREMQRTLLGSGVSVKERSKKGIYNSQGELTKQWAGVNAVRGRVLREERERAGPDLSAKAMAMKPHAELEALDASYKDIKGKMYDEKGRLTAAWRRNDGSQNDCSRSDSGLMGGMNYDGGGDEGVDLSAQASALRHRSEADSTLGNFRSTTIKERIYSADGQLNSWSRPDKVGDLLSIAMGTPTEMDSPKEMDLSTTGNLKKKERELERLRSTGSMRRGVKGRIYSEDGQLNAWNKLKTKEVTVTEPREEWGPTPILRTAKSASYALSPPDANLGERRRKEFEAVMRDRSLSREERHRKIEEIKAKYAANRASDKPPPSGPEGGEMKLGAADMANRHRNELDSFRSKMKSGTVRTASSVKDRIYDGSGRLNAWSRWEKKDEVEVEAQSERPVDLLTEIKKAREIEHSDADGSAIASASNRGDAEEQDGEMDLSAAGMYRKKSREIDLLRMMANPKGLKQKMYNERGELVGSINNYAEQDRHNPGMDLSAAGMKLKKAREMEALRRSAREFKEGAKNAMYDESGQLNAWNSKQKNVDTAHMDLSTVGSIKKKDAELNAIRAMARQRRGVKDRIYDSCGQLNAWTSLKEDEEMDLSAEGMKLKKAREIESLRTSMHGRRDKRQMHDANGNIINARNNNGEQDMHNSDMDLSAEGMKRKRSQEINALRAKADPQGLKQKMYNERGEIVSARNNESEQNSHNTQMDVTAMMRKRTLEIEAIRTGSVDHKETVAPRKLTDDEASSLRTTLKSKLNIKDESNEEDAADLLDYAFDMIGDGKAVGEIMQELVFMEMDVLKADMADSFGHCISTFFLGMGGGDGTLLRRSKSAMYDESGHIIGKKNSKDRDNKEPSEDEKRRQELLSIMNDCSLSHDEREKQIEEVKSRYSSAPQSNQGPGNSSHTAGIIHNTGVIQKATPEEKALELKRRQEFQALMKDRSLSREERAQRIEEMKEKHSASTEGSSVGATPRAKLDLSALACARKAKAEMKAELLAAETSAKERSKQEMYDENGILIKQWDDLENETDEPEVHGINLSARAAADRAAFEVDSLLVKLKSDGGIQHRLANYSKSVEPKSLYHHDGDDHDENRMKGLDLSAKAFSEKSFQEVRATLSTGAESVKERSKQGNYDSNGVLIKQWAKLQEENTTDIQQFEHEQDQLLAEQTKHQQANSKDGGPEFRLSAQSQARKPQKEIKALQSIADSKGVKKAIYNENGVLIKQWAHFNGDCTTGEGPVQPAGVSGDSSLDEQRKQEFQAIMRDRSLSREERFERIEEMKTKYSSSPHESQGSGKLATSTERDFENGSDLDLSAIACARKTSDDMKATLLSSPTSAKERNKRIIYDENGVLIKQWAGVKEEEQSNAPSFFKSFMSKSVDEQRRDELQLIMKDRSLTKEERAERIEEVKLRYEAAAAGGQVGTPTQAQSPPPKAPPSNCIGKSKALDAQRRKELKAIMKNRSLDIDKKNRLMEEVKLKYDLIEVDDNGKGAEGTDSVEATHAEPNGTEFNGSADETQAEGKRTESNAKGKYERTDRIQEKEKTESNDSIGSTQTNEKGAEIGPGCINTREASEEEARSESSDTRGSDTGGQVDLHTQAQSPPPKAPPSSCIGKSKVLDAQRRKELKAIMKNRSLDIDERNRLMEEVKLKYDLIEVDNNGVEAEGTDSVEATHTEPNTTEFNGSADETQAEGKRTESSAQGKYERTDRIQDKEKIESNDVIGSMQTNEKGAEIDRDCTNATEAFEEEARSESSYTRSCGSLNILDSDFDDDDRSQEESRTGSISPEDDTTQEGSSRKGTGGGASQLILEALGTSRRGSPTELTPGAIRANEASANTFNTSIKDRMAIFNNSANTFNTSIKDRMAIFNNDTPVNPVQFASSQNKSKSSVTRSTGIKGRLAVFNNGTPANSVQLAASQSKTKLAQDMAGTIAKSNDSIEYYQHGDRGTKKSDSLGATHDKSKTEIDDSIDAKQAEVKGTERGDAIESAQAKETGAESHVSIETANEEVPGAIRAKEASGNTFNSSVKDLMAVFNNSSPVDPVQLATSKNKSKPSVTRNTGIKGRMAVFNNDTPANPKRYAASQSKTKSAQDMAEKIAKSNNLIGDNQDGDRGTKKTDSLGATQDESKPESEKSANKYNYSNDDGESKAEKKAVKAKGYEDNSTPTIDCDPPVKNNKSEAESAKIYNYTHGNGKSSSEGDDGDEEYREFLRALEGSGDSEVVAKASTKSKIRVDDKAAKKEAKKSAKSFGIDCDPLEISAFHQFNGSR